MASNLWNYLISLVEVTDFFAFYETSNFREFKYKTKA